MKSLIQDAIARANQETRVPLAPAPQPSPQAPRAPQQAWSPPPPQQATPAPAPQPQQQGGTTDDELANLLRSLNTRIKVVGCGGGGSNTIWRLSQAGIEGCDLVACNTDAQHLLNIKVPTKILIGRNTTRGLGAGALPQIGEKSAIETEGEIRKSLEGADLVFITAGMGGGTGTGSAPVVARIAREMGALTVAVVTFPFKMEGAVRAENAEHGLARLRECADTTIVIPNDKLLEIVPNLPLTAAFKVADEVLHRSIRGLTEMITKPGLVNLDFADLRTIMSKGGTAMIGLGESDTENRARDAVEEALNSPLLDVDVSSATGCLVEVVGGQDMTLKEAQDVVEVVHQRVGPDARIIWGASVNPRQERSIRVMLVVTGVKSRQMYAKKNAEPIVSGTAPRLVKVPQGPGFQRGPGPADVDFVL